MVLCALIGLPGPLACAAGYLVLVCLAPSSRVSQAHLVHPLLLHTLELHGMVSAAEGSAAAALAARWLRLCAGCRCLLQHLQLPPPACCGIQRPSMPQLLRALRREFLSMLEVSEEVWVARVHVVNAYRKEVGGVTASAFQLP